MKTQQIIQYIYGNRRKFIIIIIICHKFVLLTHWHDSQMFLNSNSLQLTTNPLSPVTHTYRNDFIVLNPTSVYS
jgi:hypothetical protein